MGLIAALASTEAQRRGVFELRHRVYVEELGGVFPEAAAAAGQLREPVDDVAYNYCLVDAGRVVGSLRVVDLHRIDPGPVVERYGIADLVARHGRDRVCLAGRLALESAYRNRGHMLRLVERAYVDARARRLKFAVSDCSPELLPLYRRLGYSVHGAAFQDPALGPKVPIVWPLEAPGRALERAGASPAAKVCARGR